MAAEAETFAELVFGRQVLTHGIDSLHNVLPQCMYDLLVERRFLVPVCGALQGRGSGLSPGLALDG